MSKGPKVLDELRALAEAYGDASWQVRQDLDNYGRALWRSMGRDRRDRDIEHFIDGLLPRVLAGQEQLSELTLGYLQACAETLGCPAPDLSAVDYDWIHDGVRGVAPEVVYERPAHTMRKALAEGKSFEQAVEAGELRLLQIIGGDCQITRTGSANRGMHKWQGAGGAPQFYRRVLTGRENCALCVVASTQHYRVDHVMPIHPGCDCGFEPIPAGMGLERVIDPDVLEAAHQAVADRTGESNRSARGYENLLLTVDHDEYGPVVSWKSNVREYAHREHKEQLLDKKRLKKDEKLLPLDAWRPTATDFTEEFWMKTIYGFMTPKGKAVGGHLYGKRPHGKKSSHHTETPKEVSAAEFKSAILQTVDSPDVLISRGGTYLARKNVNGIIYEVAYRFKRKTGIVEIAHAIPLSGTINRGQNGVSHVRLVYKGRTVPIPFDERMLKYE